MRGAKDSKKTLSVYELDQEKMAVSSEQSRFFRPSLDESFRSEFESMPFFSVFSSASKQRVCARFLYHRRPACSRIPRGAAHSVLGDRCENGSKGNVSVGYTVGSPAAFFSDGHSVGVG